MLHLAFFLLLYFLPTIIARDKRDAFGIFLLNLFLGWTIIGWLMALVWAVTAPSSMLPAAVRAGYRYCPRCGMAAYPGAHFCATCGQNV